MDENSSTFAGRLKVENTARRGRAGRGRESMKEPYKGRKEREVGAAHTKQTANKTKKKRRGERERRHKRENRTERERQKEKWCLGKELKVVEKEETKGDGRDRGGAADLQSQ